MAIWCRHQHQEAKQNFIAREAIEKAGVSLILTILEIIQLDIHKNNESRANIFLKYVIFREAKRVSE